MKKEAIIKEGLERLHKQHNITSKDILHYLQKPRNEIPLSIFSKKLSSLETIIKYLRENQKLSFVKIAELTNRNQKALCRTYHNALKKQKEPFKMSETQKVSEHAQKSSKKISDIIESEFYFPIYILKNRNLSVLEAIVTYLKEKLNLSLVKISSLLKRDPSTIWTIHNRALKKKNEK